MARKAKAPTKREEATVWKSDALLVADLPPMKLKPRLVRWHFADMAELPMWDAPPVGRWGGDHVWTDTESGRGGVSMPEAISMARHGWPEGAEQARTLHEGIQATIPERRRMTRYDVAGAVPSVARAIAGNPLNMRRIVPSETAQRPVITLVCDIAVNWNFSADGMLSHAAAVAATVDFLEEAGFRCEVIVIERTGNDTIGAEIAVRLKAAEQPVNLSVMAFGLGHPAYLRRLTFGLLFSEPDCAALGGSLGSAEKTPAAPERGTFTIGAASDAGDRVRAPARFRHILTELARQGCPGVPGGQEDAA